MQERSPLVKTVTNFEDLPKDQCPYLINQFNNGKIPQYTMSSAWQYHQVLLFTLSMVEKSLSAFTGSLVTASTRSITPCRSTAFGSFESFGKVDRSPPPDDGSSRGGLSDIPLKLSPHRGILAVFSVVSTWYASY